jgi:predicted DNA-binding antitoxin AbrB/MazE fold protein
LARALQVTGISFPNRQQFLEVVPLAQGFRIIVHGSFTTPVFRHRFRGAIVEARSLEFRPGAKAMTITVEATYENGTLKLEQPLPFKEHEKVRITVLPRTSWVEETYGICGWKGSAEGLDRLLAEIEFEEDDVL